MTNFYHVHSGEEFEVFLRLLRAQFEKSTRAEVAINSTDGAITAPGRGNPRLRVTLAFNPDQLGVKDVLNSTIITVAFVPREDENDE